jgi:hypothetical protein
MLNPDSKTQLQLVRERTEDLRRQYGGQQSQTPHHGHGRSGAHDSQRRRPPRLLDRLLGRPPEGTPA